MTISEVKPILDLVSSIAVILSATAGGLAAIFIARQVAHMKRSREVDTFLRLLAAGNDEKVRRAADWVKYEMPVPLRYEDAKCNPEIWTRLGTVFHHFEMIGVLVNHRYISADLVYDQMGPWIVGTWSKVEELISANRRAKRAPEYCENFELLVTGYDEWAKRIPAKLEKRGRVKEQDVRQYYMRGPTVQQPRSPSSSQQGEER